MPLCTQNSQCSTLMLGLNKRVCYLLKIAFSSYIGMINLSHVILISDFKIICPVSFSQESLQEELFTNNITWQLYLNIALTDWKFNSIYNKIKITITCANLLETTGWPITKSWPLVSCFTLPWPIGKSTHLLLQNQLCEYTINKVTMEDIITHGE